MAEPLTDDELTELERLTEAAMAEANEAGREWKGKRAWAFDASVDPWTAAALVAEVRYLRAEVREDRRPWLAELLGPHGSPHTYAETITRLRAELDARDAVIRRLLDGWSEYFGGWVRSVDGTSPTRRWYEVMLPAERAVIEALDGEPDA